MVRLGMRGAMDTSGGRMSEELEAMLWELLLKIGAGLDRIHDQAIKRLDSMARSVGQRTRVDRL